MESSKKSYISFFIVLQMIVGFGLSPLILLQQLYGAPAVIIYGLTSVVIFSTMGFWLWAKDISRDKLTPAPDGMASITFGLIFGFIMAEIVAVILVMTP